MRFRREVLLPCSASEAFDLHAREGAFERLAPPWDRLEILSKTGTGLEENSTILLQLRKLGFRKEWLAVISECSDGVYFKDVQVRGPFAKWEHKHAFNGVDASTSILADEIEYALPGGSLVNSFARGHVQSILERTFWYRHEITKNDLVLWDRYRDRNPLKILISGGYGFLGSRLSAFLRAQGHSVAVLTRSPKNGDVGWDPASGMVDKERLEGFDAVIHLAGENLASGRWNDQRKTQIWNSRVDATKLLVQALEGVKRQPQTFICASGIGYYGDCGDQRVRETDPLGTGFLAELCQAWEAESIAAESFLDRVVRLRTGVVMDAGGGALREMLPLFLMGLGGALGKGNQWLPWIALEDWIGSLYHLLMEEEAGACNLVSPNPVTSREFAKCLGSVLSRPAVMSVPAPVLRLMLGEFANEGLLSSCRAQPARLESFGYQFKYPNLGDALNLTLGRFPEGSSS